MFESKYGCFFAASRAHRTKRLARRAATSFSMTLSRGLTNAAFVEYLEADERMARVRGDREESSRKEERRTNMRLACALSRIMVSSYFNEQGTRSWAGPHPLPSYPPGGSPPGGLPPTPLP